MNRSQRGHWLERWLPFLLTVIVQFVGGVWFAAHLSDSTAQNSKDIAELKLIVVPRMEIDANQKDMKDQLDRLDGKMDRLLERTPEAK